MKKIPLLIAIILSFVLLTQPAFAAWGASENFDSYAVGADLNGASGGSGWTTNWTFESGAGKDIQNAPAGGQGGKAARRTGTNAGIHWRKFTATATETFRWQTYITTTTLNDSDGWSLRDPVNGSVINIRLANGGQVQLYSGAWVNLAAYSANTWILIDVQIDAVNQANKFRVRVDSGTWSSWYTVYGGTLTSINEIRWDSSASDDHDFWMDCIQDGGTSCAAAPTAAPRPMFPSTGWFFFLYAPIPERIV